MMNFIAALFAVYFLTQCSCKNHFRKLPSEEDKTASAGSSLSFTLNLADIDATKVMFASNVNRGIDYKLIYPKHAVSVTAIVDGPRTVWTADQTTRCSSVHIYSIGYLTLLQLSLRVSDDLVFKYFEKIGSRWVRIPEEFFDKRWLSVVRDDFNQLIKKSLKNDNFTLDLVDPDKSRLFVSETDVDGVVYKAFFANVEETIAKIVHGNEPLWEAGSERRATSVHLFSKDGNVRLVEVLVGTKISHTFVFYEYKDGKWVNIDETNFNNKYNGLFDASSEWLNTAIPKGTFGDFMLPRNILDISKEGNEQVSVEEKVLEGVLYRTYSPKVNNRFFGKIVDSGTNILTLPAGFKCVFVELYATEKIALLVLTLKNGSEYEYEYFENNGSSWSNITSDVFSHNFNKFMKKTETLNDSSNIRVNVLSPSNETFHNKEYVHNGFKTRLVIPLDGFRIISLYYGEERVWESKGEEYCTGAVFFKNEDSHICYIAVNGEEMYFKRGKYAWKVTTSYDFNDVLSAMNLSNLEPSTLDIKNVDLDKFKVHGYKLKGVPMLKYTPVSNLRVNRVVDGSTVIWTGNERCINAWTYSVGKSSVCRLQIMDNEDIDTPLYFVKDGKWTSVDFSTFFDRLDALIKSTVKEVDVDVLSPIPGVTNVVYNDYGVETRLIAPVGGSKIVSLHYGKELLWEGKDGQYCSSATFFRRGSLHICSVMASGKGFFLKKVYGSWVGIDDKTFQDSYAKIMGVAVPEPAKNVKVDVLSSEKGPFNNLVYNDYGVETRSVSPINGFKIVSLHYGKELLWEGKDGEYCSSATFFEKDGVEIASLIVNDQEIFFEKVYGDWLCTDDKRFSEVYLKMMGVAVPEPVKEVDGTLDIAALPQETETYKPSEDSPYTFFVVSTGTPVIRVVDGPDTIWTGTNEQLCIGSSFLSNGKRTLLAQIVVEGLVETNVLYFEKRTFKWHQITEALYDFKLEQLKVLKDGFLTNSLYTITLFVAIVSGITLL